MPDQLLLVSVGNTRTRFALVREGQLEPAAVEPNSDIETLARAICSQRTEGDVGDDPAPVLLATVNRPVSDRLERALSDAGRRVSRLGTGTGDLPILIDHTLDEAGTVGPDRLLDALGAYSKAQSACVVIDAGTAITVDFVDGEGTFHGGAIAPGVRMMFEALHEKTAALPLVAPGPDLALRDGDDGPPFGKSTRPAIVLGVLSAARGLAHLLIDRYAEFYEAYPRVIATGGDAAMLFENDPLVEHIVPDLTLMGMLEAYRRLEILDQEEPADDSAR